jgi:hypothetical protein
MSRHIPVIAACAATLAFSALPASAMTSHVHDFAIPGVHGARAWAPTPPWGASPGDHVSRTPHEVSTVRQQPDWRSILATGVTTS